VAEAVIGPPALRVREDLVCLLYLFETRLGRLVARVQVRVVLPGELAVCGRYLLVGGALADAEDLVVIARLASHYRSRSSPGTARLVNRATAAYQRHCTS
jgi:hypothetical protein